jgi:hypothetical protein
VWCAISSHGIIGPYFFEDNGRATTVTSGRYANMIATSLTDELATRFPQVNEASWFQQDGATSHTARVSMDAVQLLFHNHLISRNGDIPWPPRSQDLSACDFFLRGLLKSKVYIHRPHNIEELKERIREKIAGINLEMLRRVMGNMRRLEECLRRDGGHLEDIISKK